MEELFGTGLIRDRLKKEGKQDSERHLLYSEKRNCGAAAFRDLRMLLLMPSSPGDLESACLQIAVETSIMEKGGSFIEVGGV